MELTQEHQTHARLLVKIAVGNIAREEAKKATILALIFGKIITMEKTYASLQKRSALEGEIKVVLALLDQYEQEEKLEIREEQKVAIAKDHYSREYKDAAESVVALLTETREIETEIEVQITSARLHLIAALGEHNLKENLVVARAAVSKAMQLESQILRASKQSERLLKAA